MNTRKPLSILLTLALLAGVLPWAVLPAWAATAAETIPETGEETTAAVETDGFSRYTVEFTYNDLQYVMPGDSEVKLSEILDAVGLSGEVTEVSVSDSSLFSAEKKDGGEWFVAAHKAFATSEWMKVTIGGVAYEITVTDTNGEQSVTYTIRHVTENSHYIYYLEGSDGSSKMLYEAQGTRPTKVTLEMGDDITFDVDVGEGNVFTCSYDTKSYDMLGFYDYLNTNDYDFTITSKTRIIKHVQIDGKGMVNYLAAKTTLEADGNDKTITVRWEGGEGGNRLGAPGKFIVTFAPPVQTYNISYELNGGTNASGNPSTYADNVGVSSFAEPTRTGYTFRGWYNNSNCQGTPVTSIPAGSSGNKKLYAKWRKNTYIVTWKNSDGTTIQTDTIEYGNTPSYSGATPTKAATAQYSYTFTGWSPAVTAVTGNQTYTAQFSSTTNKYTVTWKNSDGSTIKTDTVEYGKKPSYSGETPTKAGDGKYSYTFKGWSPSITSVTGAATYTAAYTKTPIATYFSQSGDTYTIHDAVGWEIFCECLQDVETYNHFSGKTVVLGDDITVTTMAGSSDNHFCGTFDGNGKTLTVSYDAGVDYAAPFRYANDGCVIENLHVDGAIATSCQFAAGVIGEQYGAVTIRNCRVSVTIKSSKDGDGTHGGFIGIKGDSNAAHLTIEGCVFDGRIVSTGSNATTDCGGFVGWTKSKGSLTITNSLYAPAADDDAVSTGATFARNWTMPDNANCYYTAALGSEQGKRAYAITAGENVTVANAGTVTTYDVSGITSCGTGIKYNDVLYAGVGEEVSLTLGNTPASGMKKLTVTGATASLTETAGRYTFTMPANDVTAVFADVTPTITVAEATYTGTAQTPTVTVKDGETTLDAGTHYTVSEYSNNINAGTDTASVSITGKGFYLGTASQTFSISPAPVALTANSGTEVYDGTEKTVTGFTSSVDGPVFAGVAAGCSGTDAGEYDVTFSGVTVNETKDSTGNYIVTGTTNGKLTINRKPVTVTAKAQSVAVGGSIATDTEQATLTGAVEGHTLAAVTLSASDTSAATTEGTITPSAATIKDASGNDVTVNYNITYKTGILTVTAPVTYTLTVTAPTFDAVYAGYVQPDAKALTIKSTGSSDAAISGVALSGTNTGSFTLNKTDGATITAGATDSTTYTVQPNADLAAGTYTATITVTYNNNATATADVSFTVYGATGDWSGGKLVATVTLPTNANALLIAASYNSAGRQVGIKVIEMVNGKTTYETGLTKTSGYTYKLMLVNKTTFAPLCAAWEKKA